MRGPEKAGLRAGVGVFDDIISDELNTSVSPTAKDDLARYQSLDDPYSAFKQVSKAVQSARGAGGQFTPRQLSAAARDNSPLAPLAQAAGGSLGSTSASPSWPIGHAGGAIGAAYGLLSHPAGTAAAIGGGNLLATQTVQRAWMGDTAAQKAVSALLKAHPDMAAAVQTVVRNAATAQMGANTGQ